MTREIERLATRKIERLYQEIMGLSMRELDALNKRLGGSAGEGGLGGVREPRRPSPTQGGAAVAKERPK